jgi:hypothetical protein
MWTPSDADVLEAVQAAFARCKRPEHFTNYWHCEECAEHDELLRSRDNDTLQEEDVGNPGWDPLCYVDPEGFGYFFPALARMSLAEPSPTRGWYGQQLLFHVNYDGKANRHLLAFDMDQRQAVALLLQHIGETRAQLVAEYLCIDDIVKALQTWSGH